MFDFLRKKRSLETPIVDSTLKDEYEDITKLMAMPRRTQKVDPIRLVVEPIRHVAKPINTKPNPVVSIKGYNIAKDTNIIRLHNDLISKLKEQKGDRTFNDFINELVNNARVP